MPFLSIIIPTYKEEGYIGETLANLSGLTIPHEIIVSDDKSPDRTIEVARSYAGVTVIEAKEKHAAIGANRNMGARHSKGDILVFLDSDSRPRDVDSFFKRALKRFYDEPGLAALTGQLRVSPAFETTADRIVYIVFNFVHYLKNDVLRMGESSGKFQMIRRSAFEQVKGFREDLITREDADMFQRLSKVGRTRYDGSLVILHTGRRAHRIGWPKLLWIWTFETAYVAMFKKAKVAEWQAIR